MRFIEWQDGVWSNEPVSSRTADGQLVAHAAKGSDYWEKTMYGFQHDNGHALLALGTRQKR